MCPRRSAVRVPCRPSGGYRSFRFPGHPAAEGGFTKGDARMGARIRVVVAKPGLDGHDRGAKVVARALRDAGMEVIYTGLHQTPEQIVETAIQEDADAVGLSVLSGAHMTLFTKVVDLLAQRGADDIVVFGGGIIPDADIPELEKLGVAKIFTPGATTTSIVEWVRAHVAAQVG
jgi:methylmalonyl-CoA mutase C-terminal domain/subunit